MTRRDPNEIPARCEGCDRVSMLSPCIPCRRINAAESLAQIRAEGDARRADYHYDVVRQMKGER